jgi:predicted Zn finger-like uncharacterized protein
VQASCPQCSNRIVVDDAKVPERAFSVKCPKCGNVLRLPGKGAAAPALPASESTLPPTPLPGAGAPAVTEELRAQMMAQLRREMGASEAGSAHHRRALVALPDRGLAGAATLTLTRNGYAVDTLDDWEEGARLLEQGVYALVVTARAGASAAKGESLYQRLNRLNPEGRRRLFVVLVGQEFKTGDGTQAFVSLADLVIHPRDVPAADGALRNTIGERARLWQAFLDARARFETAISV